MVWGSASGFRGRGGGGGWHSSRTPQQINFFLNYKGNIGIIIFYVLWALKQRVTCCATRATRRSKYVQLYRNILSLPVQTLSEESSPKQENANEAKGHGRNTHSVSTTHGQRATRVYVGKNSSKQRVTKVTTNPKPAWFLTK